MRWLALAALAALVPLLAGCTVPTDEPTDPLFGLCPQWSQGPDTQALTLSLAGNDSADRELGPANATHQGRPLDLYRVRLDKLDVAERTELRATAADGTRLNIRDYRQTSPQLVPVVVFTDGSAAGQDFDVFLSSVGHSDQASPAPVTLRWSQVGGAATVEASVTFHYKVCGAEL